jgi:hypothetical protein
VQSGPAVVVVEVVTVAAAVDLLVVDDVWFEDEVVVLDEDTWSAAAIGWMEKFLSCAYAAIPPEIRTRIAAAVRICSLPVSKCISYRISFSSKRFNGPHPGTGIMQDFQLRAGEASILLVLG